METLQPNFSELPRHEMLRAIGQTTVQAGLFMIAVSAVLKHLGNLPDSPLSANFNETSSQQQNNSRGYFD